MVAACRVGRGRRCQGLKTSRHLTTCSPAQALSVRRRPEFFQQNRQGFTQLEPVAGGVCEEESALSSKASILDSSAASRSFSFLSCFVRFLLSSSLCSMSYTGRQLNIANKRRQGGKVETHSDLLMGRESAEVGEVVIAVVGGERNQQEQGTGHKR